MLPFLVGESPDLADTALAICSGQSTRIVSGKDHRTADEMSRGPTRAREMESEARVPREGSGGGICIPRLFSGRSQGRRSKFPWNVACCGSVLSIDGGTEY